MQDRDFHDFHRIPKEDVLVYVSPIPVQGPNRLHTEKPEFRRHSVLFLLQNCRVRCN